MITAFRHHITTWLAVVVALIAPTGSIMPVLENTISPIITDSQIENVTRDGNRMCFDWRHSKRRAAPQLFFLFWASSPKHPDRSMLQAAVVGQGEPRPLRTRLARPAGTEMPIRLCFDLPKYIADDSLATVTGYVTYEGGARTWWRMSYTIGPATTQNPSLEGLEVPTAGMVLPPPP
jgi:hypothetical protein